MYPILVGELKAAMAHCQILLKNMVGHRCDKLLLSYWQKNEKQILFTIDLAKVSTQEKSRGPSGRNTAPPEDCWHEMDVV